MNTRTITTTLASVAALLVLAAVLLATGVVSLPRPGNTMHPGQGDQRIDETTRSSLIAAVIGKLEQHYIFPEQSKAMAAHLRDRQGKGDYAGIDSAAEFAATLTADLHAISHDRHIDVGYSAQPLPEAATAPDPQMQAMQAEHARMHNFGFQAIERLPLNIGYLDLQAFEQPEQVASRIAAVMTLLADTDALIIDLRNNHGGYPESVTLLASYLFDQRTHLNDIYYRDGDRTEQAWTHDQVAGPRYGSQRPVYLLTSEDTFSAGEDFAYALKNLKRATLVGESTGGGAHPADEFRLGEHFGMLIPTARSISPITQTDWEGVGVTPDHAVAADQALAAAQTLLLTAQLQDETDPETRERIEQRLAELD